MMRSCTGGVHLAHFALPIALASVVVASTASAQPETAAEPETAESEAAEPEAAAESKAPSRETPEPETAPPTDPEHSEPAVDPAPPPAVEASVASSEPDADALLAELDAELGGADSVVAGTPSLRLYGFADFTLSRYFLHPDTSLRSTLYPRTAFSVGNLNLYAASDLGSGWESLAEVRFSYLPNGARRITGSTVERQDTLVGDYTHLGQNRRYGGLFIERVWLKYTAHPLLAITGGHWLTPYGVWNEDHGSPTIIPVVRPYVIGLELLPESQTGVKIEGTGYPSESLSLGYAVGLSNGRGPVSAYADFDGNKAVTLRLSGSHRGEGTLAFGLSGYYGRYTDIVQTAAINGAGVRLRDEVVEQYDELSYGADLRYTNGGFHGQAEFILNERAYTDEGRTPRTAATFHPDNRRHGGYAVIGYRFDWMGLMPYVIGEYFALVNTLEPTRPPTNDTIRAIGVGLNSRPTHTVTLKLEGMAGTFGADIPEGSAFAHPLGAVQAQAAWAF